MSEILDETGIEKLEIPPVQLISCPRCKADSPNHYFCVNCGQPLTVVDSGQEDDSSPTNSEKDPLEDLTPLIDQRDVDNSQKTLVSKNPTSAQTVQEPNEPASGMSYVFKPIEEPRKMESFEQETSKQAEQEVHTHDLQKHGNIEAKKGYVTSPLKDDVISEAMRDLVKRVSLLLWLTEMLSEGRLKEDYFQERFDEYKSAFNASVSRREELLGHARDIDSLEASLEKSKVCLEEFEERKRVGDLREGEYAAKLPAMKWDIDHYENELFLRSQERENLEDATWLLSNESIKKLRDRAIASRDALNAHDPESYLQIDLAEVTAPLDKITEFLDEIMGNTEEIRSKGKSRKKEKEKEKKDS